MYQSSPFYGDNQNHWSNAGQMPMTVQELQNMLWRRQPPVPPMMAQQQQQEQQPGIPLNALGKLAGQNTAPGADWGATIQPTTVPATGGAAGGASGAGGGIFGGAEGMLGGLEGLLGGAGGAGAMAGPAAIVAAIYGLLEHTRKTQDESIGRQLTHPGLTAQRLLEEGKVPRRLEQALGGDVGGFIGSTLMALTELMGGDVSNANRRMKKDNVLWKLFGKIEHLF